MTDWKAHTLTVDRAEARAGLGTWDVSVRLSGALKGVNRRIRCGDRIVLSDPVPATIYDRWRTGSWSSVEGVLLRIPEPLLVHSLSHDLPRDLPGQVEVRASVGLPELTTVEQPVADPA